MHTHPKWSAAALLAVALVSGCATVTRGRSDALVITSDPAGARVETTEGDVCDATPCALRLPRSTETVLTFTRARCAPARMQVTHRTADGGAVAMAGNVVAGGIVGAAVDARTGATQELVPNPVEVTLDCDD